jgi:imidazoleglycerol-phosphate dehydratase/histidinol-phosphatase
MTKKKVLFIDRDGTIILETDDFKIDTMDKIAFYPHVFYWLGKIVREFDLHTRFSHQPRWIGYRMIFQMSRFLPRMDFIMKTFAEQGNPVYS